ncbi:uncharacterized protein LOC122965289 isoform X2 [Acropora millepora]|uniref:uncharacterized protein LOC122965289 isoform X2 n=1 Tax=Acropora millepora TaxID=45264 RepID=UPI001CF0E694|nr:uncharacterized protein LOC122965289 isoform X2 [Acropora millepora]
MQKPVERNYEYVVHLFEMESSAYYNIGNDEYFSENWTTSRNLGKGRENSVPPSGNVGHCAKTPGRRFLFKNVGRDKEETGETTEEQPEQFYRIPRVLPPPEKKFYKKANCSVKRLTNNHVYNNAVNRQKCLGTWETKGKKSGREEAKLDLPTGLKCLEEQQKRKCCGPREIACLQVLTLLMAAAGLTLVVLIIGGKITCLPESLKDAPAPEKLVYFSSELRELKENFTKLKEELDYTRQELARLREGSKHLTEGKARNITTQVNHSSDQENVKLMLNSSEQRLMEVISNVWVQVNKTGRELWEETTKLRMAENSSQEEIQRIKRSLTDLRQEGNSREKRINETIHLKLKNNDAMMSLKMLLNSSFQEMQDELSQIWSSLHSSEKDLQAMWIAINTTEQDLTLKITNVSRITGPKKALGSNGKGGLRGCKYKVHIGNDTVGSDVVDASLEEPMGSRIIGATCSTNYAQEYNLESNISSTKRRRFICNCRGPSQLFFPVGKEKRECRLHYWLCSMI